nr:helix-turn-helix domain-containing protein [Actinomycetota bacterium]
MPRLERAPTAGLRQPAWAWTSHGAGPALQSRDLGAILRAFRAAHGLSQEQLAARLGYDKTYISMIETGRRAVHDVASRRQIARALPIPAHLLGVTDPLDADFTTMIAFAESVIRLADRTRAGGQAAEAAAELWPLIARLEARARDGTAEPPVLAVLGKAWTSLGVSLGTILPEERLQLAVRWTGKGLAAARRLDDPATLTWALAMHGNELRKNGRPGAAGMF